MRSRLRTYRIHALYLPARTTPDTYSGADCPPPVPYAVLLTYA